MLTVDTVVKPCRTIAQVVPPAAYSSFVSVVADSPMCLLPASTPRVMGCVIFLIDIVTVS